MLTLKIMQKFRISFIVTFPGGDWPFVCGGDTGVPGRNIPFTTTIVTSTVINKAEKVLICLL